MLSKGYVSDQANELFSPLEAKLMYDSLLSMSRNLFGSGKRGSLNPQKESKSKICVLKKSDDELSLEYIAGSKGYYFAGAGHFRTDLFLPGQYTREDVLRCAETFLGGNTDYETPLREALRLMAQDGFEQADMVFVTDGACALPDAFTGELKKEQAARGFQITGVLLDAGSGGFAFSLQDFCREIYRTSQFSPNGIAERLVVSRAA